jgi:hypothetical protein
MDGLDNAAKLFTFDLDLIGDNLPVGECAARDLNKFAYLRLALDGGTGWNLHRKSAHNQSMGCGKYHSKLVMLNAA